MTLEDKLRRALAPEPLPKDFTARVAARIDANKLRSARDAMLPGARRRRFIVIAMAAAIAIGTGSTLYYTHLRQVSEAERVRNDAVTGLRIASAKLNDVYERLQRLSTQNERSR